MGELDQPGTTFAITCVHDVIGATVMHIHRAPAGVNGGVAFDLGDPASPVTATWTGMTPADIADLLAGDLYVNIHTAGRPAGEIRGQILERTVDLVAFTADGSQVVPSNESASTANCTADLNTAATALDLACTHTLPSPSAAHVHVAPFGEIGPVAFTFPSAASPLSGSMPLTPLQVASFAAKFLYLDIHAAGGTEESPADEIRGQIGLPPAGAGTGTIIITKSTSPAGGTGFDFTDDVPGSGSFSLDDGGQQELTGVTAGTYTVTELLPAGYSLTDVSCSDADSAGNPFARTATVNLEAGETVTCTFTNLQTPATSQLFVFHLSGAQEVPPNASVARGGCMGQLDGGAAAFSIVCTHNVDQATTMHIHRAPVGANGPVVFDLEDPISPVEATWTGMTPGDIADLLAGNLYVNIHAAGRPAGEIRGQILPRTVDNFFFQASGDQEVPPTGSAATGQCFSDLNDGATALFVSCDHDVVNPTLIHLHSAPPGSEGPVAFHFGLGAHFEDDVPMSPRLVADFAAGFLYVNIHTADSPEGEIRGQLIAGAAPPAAVVPIPTLGEWATALMLLSLLGLAWWRMR